MAPVDAQNWAIPGAIPPKIGENLSWDQAEPPWKNFTPISKAPAEKSVTVLQKNEKATVNLVSRPYCGMAG